MNKTILITGCSSGIGHATAKNFAEKDWNVIATMRAPEKETELTNLKNILVARLDVQDRESIRQAIENGIERFGKIDALVNNAGFSLSGVFEEISPEKILEQFAVNVFGVMNVTRALLPHFRKNKNGIIVNVSSRAGLVGLPMLTHYCASKFALEGFSESLAYELASQNIAVKIVEPSGGVSGTNFSNRLSAEHVKTSSLTDYDEFVARTNKIYSELKAPHLVSSETVAQVIYDAATDDKNQLRYFIGEDTGNFVKAKREMSDEKFIEWMRSRFLSWLETRWN